MEMESAFEKAMRRAEALPELNDDEKLKLLFVPRGEELATSYLKNQIDLQAAVDECPLEAQAHFINAACRILVHNIRLPRTDMELDTNTCALSGLSILKKDKKGVQEIASRVTKICQVFRQYYPQGLEQCFRETREAFQRQLEESMRTSSAFRGHMPTDIQNMPEFQKEWSRAAVAFTARYQDPLDEQKGLLIEMV